MPPLEVMIVDDEPLALRRLQYDLARIDDVKIVAATTDSTEALALIRRLSPAALFLDIKMPALNGFELIEALAPDATPAVIFVTAYNRFAAEAFDVAAVDYLLKPIRFDLLQRAVGRARAALEGRDGARLSRLRDAVAALRRQGAAQDSGYETELWLFQGPDRVRVPVSTIERIEAERDYVHVRTAERGYLLRSTLSALEARLDPARFMRVHRSAIVRIDAIQRVDRRPAANLSLAMASGGRVAVGRGYRPAVRSWLEGRTASPE